MPNLTHARVPEQQLAPVIEHFANAAHYSQEAFLELAMALEHVRRVLPDDFDSIAALMTGAYQSWQTLEEAGDEILGDMVPSLTLTGKPLPSLPPAQG